MSDETKSCCETGDKTSCCKARCCLLAAVLICTLLIVGVLINAMIKYTTPAPLGEDRVALRTKNLAELRAANADALNNYGWIDQTKGVVRLPIEQAMKLTVVEWQKPSAARADMIARVEKATAVPPKAPEKPSAFE